MTKSHLHILVAFLSLVIALSLCCFRRSFHVTGDPSDAHVFVSPPVHVAKEVGELFDMAVNVCDVIDLHSFEFRLSYNTSLLDVTQVGQGPFLPHPPESSVSIEMNEPLGFVWMNVSLIDSEPGRSGAGILARITFNVTLGIACSQSMLELQATSLRNDLNELIGHSSVDGVYFWQSMQPDPPPPGCELDLRTQKGGAGSDEPGGFFHTGEIVELRSLATYNNWPVQSLLVAFQVIEPIGSTSLVLVEKTDQNGWANVSFRIPTLPESLGLWIALSITDICGETVFDILSFTCVSGLPHGPTAAFTNPPWACVNHSVTFDATNSLPGWNGTHDMPITEYRWDLNGDGNIDLITHHATVTHSYSTEGVYYPKLTVYASGATPETNTTVGRIVVLVCLPVGGWSETISVVPSSHLWTCYEILVAVMSSIVLFIRRKTKISAHL